NEWIVCVKHFADRADAGVAEMRCKSIHEFACTLEIVGIDPQPRVDERPDEPAPDGTLVICRITRAKISVVLRLVIRMAWRKAAQADRRHKIFLRDIEDGFPSCRFENRIR